jgi:O-antigen/teichoic acid export membrane protein
LKPSDPLLVLLTYWLCFSVMGFLSHAILLRQLSREDSAGTPAVVGEYYKVGWVYLVGTLAVQACFTIDKSILALHASDEQVAVYGFCASLAYSLVTLVEAAVVSVGYPALMRAVSQRQSPGRQLLEFGCRIVIVYVVVAILLVAAFPYVVDLVGKPLYGESRSLLYLMVIAYFFYCLQYPAHYGLYARGRDGTIVVLDVLGGALFIAMAVLLAVDIGAIGMALAVLLGFLGVAGLKTFNLNRVLKFDG